MVDSQPEKLELAKMVFRDTEIKITAKDQRHLGAVIGDFKFKQGYIDDMVSDWVKEWFKDVAKFHPQCATVLLLLVIATTLIILC